MHLAVTLNLVEDFSPQVVAIDPIASFGTLGSVLQIRVMLVRLVDFLKVKGITTLFTGVCSQSSQPDESARKMNEGQERQSKFVVARGDTSELLETAEEALDQVAIPIEMTIERTWVATVGTGWDNGLGSLRFDCGNKRIRIVAFVGNNESGRLPLDQGGGLVDIRDLASRENDAQRVAQGIDCDMQFGGQPASRPPDLLTAGFFRAPAECWWARTMVESINSCSRSASPESSLAMRSQTPASRHREKRTYVLCQLPSSAGRSRHGIPVRMTQSTASTKSRLSLAVQPGSVALPGNRCSIRCHWSSRSSFRSILLSPKDQNVNTFH